MSYQVLARKWRPQRFADVLGQQAVTRTLRNALTTGKLAQAFIFAGPRGSGKTTTARLLARALNCIQGPTPEPCGVCEACVEIADGRDIDVLEIDAATHTGVDNVREVIIEGLSIAPVRDRRRVFIIDEVHMLSGSSFNALLKSIEEPPPHIVFIMATTELRRIPETVQSRSQVHEFRTIALRTVAERLRHIADAEAITVPDDALSLLARAGEGSMRDSLSALDQVRAFAGETIALEDVVSVLGLVGRDLVLDTLEAVAAEDAPAAFAMAERAVERGYDLRQFCRELARATRDLLIVSVDPSRLQDPEVAAEGERPRLQALVARSSREDLLRAFDLLTRTEQEINVSDQPRYNLEMLLLRLMYLRRLVPIAELIEQAERGGPPSSAPATPRGHASALGKPGVAPPRPGGAPASASAPSGPAPVPAVRLAPAAAASGSAPAPPVASAAESASGSTAIGAGAAGHEALKAALLGAIRTEKAFFYNTVVAQAYRVEVAPSRITFAFRANQKVARLQCEDQRGWLEKLAEKALGRRVPVTVVITDAPVGAVAARESAPEAPSAAPDEVRQQALADPAVQALLEIFPVEKTQVEEVE